MSTPDPFAGADDDAPPTRHSDSGHPRPLTGEHHIIPTPCTATVGHIGNPCHYCGADNKESA